MNKNTKNQMFMHFAASSIGGFFGGYAIYNFCELFANAQTSNLIHFVINLFTADFTGLTYVIASALTYFAGNMFFVIFGRLSKTDIKIASLAIDAAAVLSVGIISQFTDSNYALLPILFAMPVQWNSFSNDAGYVSSTIFSTNNFRQASISLVSYILDKDSAQLKKTKFYWSTLLSYHIGVALVCAASIFAGSESIWFGFLPVAVSFAVYAKMSGLGIIIRRRVRKLKHIFAG